MQLEWLSVEQFFDKWGFYPMAGGAPDGDEESQGDQDGDESQTDNTPDDSKPQEKIEVDAEEYSTLKGLKEKIGEDFDADKWGKLKGYDAEKVAENMEFGSAVEKDKFLQAVLSERIAAQRENRKMNLQKILENFKEEMEGDEKPKEKQAKELRDPRVDTLLREKAEKDAKEAQDKFDSTFIAQCKAMKLDMDEFETGLLKQAVEKIYVDKMMADARYTPDYKDIQTIIKEAFKPVEAYRKRVEAKFGKQIQDGADDAPDPITGDGSINTGKKYDPKTATREERHAQMVRELSGD